MQETEQYQVTVAFDAPCYANLQIIAHSDEAAIRQVKEGFAVGSLFDRVLDPDFQLADRHRVVSVVAPTGETIFGDYSGETVPAAGEPQVSAPRQGPFTRDELFDLEYAVKNLSAAAPDLLFALKGIMKWWMETPEFHEGTDEMPAELFDAARFAISKAEGRQ